MNRGYTGGIAARGAMPVGGGGPSPMNRGYSGGLAAGSAPGGGFRPSFPSSYGAGMQPARPASTGLSPQQQVINDINKPLDLSTPFSPAPSPSPMGGDAFSLMTGGETQAQQQQRQSNQQMGQQAFNLMGGAPFDPAAPLPPFGGFRAEGGPVMPGQAYVVGERGPELIVPQQPATVLSNEDARQMALDKASRGPNTFAALGQIPGNTAGMLIPGHSPGSSIFVPGSPAAPPVDPGMTGERRTPMLNPALFVNPAPVSLPSNVRSGTLSSRGAVPVGRSMYDLNRIAEQRFRQSGNANLLMQLNQQRTGQDFTREMDARNFAQASAMQAMNQQAQADQQARADQMRLGMWNADQQAQQARDAARFQNDLTMFGLNQGAQAMEAERKRQLEEQQRRDQSADQIIMVPTPDGKGSVPMIVEKGGNRRPIGGYIPNQAPEVPSYVKDPVTGQMVPTGPEANRRPILQPQENEGWSVRGVPYVPYEPNAKPPAGPITRTIYENGISVTAQWDPQTGQWIRVQTAPPPAAPTAPAAGATGGRFSGDIQRLMGGVK